MIRILKPAAWEARAKFLSDVRAFFRSRDVLEVETPLLNVHGTVEPFLDPFSVARTARPKSPSAKEPAHNSFLITSPEYNLKILLSALQRDIFQIAHCFREGDSGDHHSEEFLMLEWYRVGYDELHLMKETALLVESLARQPYSIISFEAPTSHTVADLFQQYCDCGLSRPQLEDALRRFALVGPREQPKTLRYDELFFALFLNRIEPHIGRTAPAFVYDYPPELAALSVIEEGRARRFELFWKGQELANGYFELCNPEEQVARFAQENALRQQLGKPFMPADPQFVAALERGLPPCSGIALGLDRLLMVLLGEDSLAAVSPFLPSVG